MDKFEDFYKEHCLDGYDYNPDLNWVFEKHEDGSYIQIEVENAKKVFQHQQAKVEELQKRVDAVVIEIEKLYLSGVIGFGTVKKLEQALKGGG